MEEPLIFKNLEPEMEYEITIKQRTNKEGELYLLVIYNKSILTEAIIKKPIMNYKNTIL